MSKIENADTLKIGYDYKSVMHYSRWQCGKFPKNPSMSFPRYHGNPDNVGQREMISGRDIQHINTIHCSSKLIMKNIITNNIKQV